MPAGIQIWDASGNLVLDGSHRIMRIIDTVFLTNGLNGSRTDSRLAQGGWVSFQPDNYIGFLSGGIIHPQFTISGSTISWSFAAKNSATYDTYQNGYIFYGAF